MIIIRDNGTHEMVDIFETVRNFKCYIFSYLVEMEEGMLADGLIKKEDVKFQNKNISFQTQLNEYLQVNSEYEIIVNPRNLHIRGGV